jgi:septal ring factor EnvC (AmiA/AmiB activator)
MTKDLQDCTEFFKQQQERQECIRDQEKQISELREDVRRLKEEAAAKIDETSETNCALDEIPTSELSREHIERYSRQLLLNDGFGVEGQRKLLASSVLVTGAGGIGSSGTYMENNLESSELRLMTAFPSFD